MFRMATNKLQPQIDDLTYANRVLLDTVAGLRNDLDAMLMLQETWAAVLQYSEQIHQIDHGINEVSVG
jgi:hypothetical protein